MGVEADMMTETRPFEILLAEDSRQMRNLSAKLSSNTTLLFTPYRFGRRAGDRVYK